MNKFTSIYLDLLRVIAAFGVLFVHANLPWFSDGLFLKPELGHKLVMVFFVLSGYLIAYTVDKKDKGSKQYLVDRFSRLYSVVLPALLLTYLLDFMGERINPSFYSPLVSPKHAVFSFVANAAFLQQIWSFCTKPSSNGPFWSIAYEFWYYILFWAFCYLKGIWKYVGYIIICLIIGVKILLLLPVWIMGVIAYKYSGKIKLNANIALVLFAFTLVVIFAFIFFLDFSFFSNQFKYGSAPLYFSSQFIFDWILGAIIAVNLFLLNFIHFNIIIPVFIGKGIKYLSSITFSLYLYHFPMLIFIAAIMHYNRSSYLQVMVMIAAVVLIIILISAVTENQRNWWKVMFNKLFSIRI